MNNLTEEKTAGKTLSRAEKQALIAKLLKEKQQPKLEVVNTDELIAPRAGDQPLPLSFTQKRLWAIDNIDEGSLPYNMSTTLKFEGQLHTGYLVRTLGALLERHEVLRTQYHTDDSGDVFQHIVAEPQLDFRIIDAEGRADWQSQLENLRTQELQTGFDLQADILFRARLLSVSPELHFLVLTTHHIAADGWSIGVINEELSQLYAAFSKGEANPLAKNDLQYADYALWQQSHEHKIVSEQLAFWRDKLDGSPATCTFPTDFPRPDHSSYRGNSFRQLIAGEDWQAMQALAREHRVSTFMVLHSLLACLLQRFTGEQDIVIGTPVANREQRQVKNLVGFFVNTLALRLDFSGQPGFDAVLASSRNCLLEACEHQQLPFEKLVDELQTDRSTNISPLFQVVLAYNNNASSEVSLPGVNVSRLPQKTVTSKFDLSLNVEDTADGLEILWEYATDLYAHTTIQTLSDYFELLLKAVIANPTQPVNRLPLLSDAEQVQLSHWNSTTSRYPKESHLWHLFTQQAQEQGNKIALWEARPEGDTLAFTYSQLQTRAEQLARRINLILPVARHREAIVGVFSERSADAVVAWLALARLGYAYLPLDPKYPADRLQHMLTDAGCQLVLTQNRDQFEQLPGAEHFQTMALDQASLYQGELPAFDEPVIDSNRLAYVMYTSGSTGKPKGVMIEQAAIIRLIKNTGYAPLSADDHILLTGAPVFDATTYEVWGSLLNGGTLSIVDEQVLLDTEQLAGVLRDRGITTLWLTAPLFNQHVQQQPAMFSGLNQLLVGGDALSVEHIRLARRANPELTVINGYGPTENTTFSVCHRMEAGEALGDVSSIPIGKPIHNSTAHVVNDAGQPVPVGVCGELWVGGDGVARGYLNREQLTAEKFIADPFSDQPGARLYKTGDLVRWTRDGVIEFIGRVDDQVKIRGFRIELGEIDTALTRHPLVEEARVLVKQDGQGNKQLVGYVAIGAALDSHQNSGFRAELQSWLAESLPDYMVPAALVLMDKLPLNKNGKVDRKLLPEPEFARASEQLVAAETDAEKILLAVWQKLLGVEAISVTDNFFAIGGDSIQAIRVVAQAREAGLSLTVKKIFEGKSIRNIARLATIEAKSASDDLPPVTGSQKLLPIHCDFFAGNPGEYNHFNQQVTLMLDSHMPLPQLTGVLQWLMDKHDAMRLRFNSEQGQWCGQYVPLADVAVAERIEEHHLESFSDGALVTAIDKIANAAQASLNIHTGVTCRWVVMRTAEETRLLWIMHHLVVDGVSWRILLQDFHKALTAVQQHQPLPGFRRSSSCQAWAERLHAFAGSDAMAAEKNQWAIESAVSLPFIQATSKSAAEVTVWLEKDTCQQTFCLSETQTRELLQDSHRARHTQMNDLLLAGLSLAVNRLLGSGPSQGSLRIDLEGHGREELFDDLDLSETVGWFTSLFPVHLPTGQLDVDAAIVDAKETLAAIPNNGIGYGIQQWLATDGYRCADNADIAFNYLGQLDAGTDSGLNFSLEHGGNPIGGERQRSHAIRITGFVKAGQLQFVLDYHPEQIAPSVMEELADNFQAALVTVTEHCRTAESRYTPADFPLAAVSRDELADIQGRYPELSALFPMTSMQQNLILQSLRADTQTGVYVTQLRFSFREADAHIMKRAWQEISNRHGIFRSVFIQVETDNPLQLVLPEVEIQWRETGVADQVDTTAREQRIAAIAEQERALPFDFAAAPAQRFVWIDTAEGGELIWSHHHALIDGWCLSLLLDELLQLYAGINRAQPATLAAVDNYENYIAWMAGRDRQQAVDYWQQYLAGSEGATPLAVEAAELAAEPGQRAECVELSSALTGELEQLAKNHGVTLNAVLQGAWAMLLSKYSGEKDVLFGTTVSGRPAELRGADRMVGLFINTLPVRQQFDDSQQLVGQWLNDIHHQMLEATEHSYLPVGDIQQTCDSAAGGLFESVLVFENYPLDIANLNQMYAGQPVFDHIHGHECSDLPVNLVIYPGDNLQIKLAYQQNRFDRTGVQRVLGHYRQILQSLTEARRLADVSLLTAEEIQRATQVWNQTENDYPRDKTLFQCFVDRSRSQPSTLALVDTEAKLTYAELAVRAENLALQLASNGVGNGMRVAVSLPKGADLVASMLAIMKLGAVYVPVALDCPAERRRFIAEDAGIAHTILRREHLSVVDDLVGEQHGQRKMTAVLVDGPAIEKPAAVCLPTATDATAEAYVIYTSGTTGNPKGVAIAHRSLVNLCYSCMADNWLQPGEGALQFAPYTFDASMAEVFVCLLSGGCLHMVNDALISDPQTLQQYLVDEDIRLAAFPPQYLQQLDAQALPESLSILTAGSAPTLQLVEDWGSCHRYLNAYGPTETTVLSSAWEYDAATLARGKLPIGKPLANTRIYIVDQFGQLCAPGQKGEIVIGGDGVALGYINRPEQTARQFAENRWLAGDRVYRTGDLGRWLEDGAVEFLGRCDHQVKIRGFRIEPDEIERCCLQESRVEQCLVLPVADRFGDLKLVAFIETDAREADIVTALKTRIAAELPHYMMPAQFVVCADFPMTANGKIDRKALAGLQASAQQSESQANDLGNAVGVSQQEKQLLAIWQHFLGTPELQVTDDFFEFGGNSILLLRMMKPMKDAGFDISVNEFYQRKTVRRCCELFKRDFDSVQFWREHTIAFDIVTLESRRERLDIWLVDSGADRELVNQYFQSLDDSQLPDFIEFSDDLAHTRLLLEQNGKAALSGWHYPYQRSLNTLMRQGLDQFAENLRALPVSAAMPFSPMQENMLDWQDRTVFELIDLYGCYSSEQLQAAFQQLMASQELMRALPDSHRRWQLLAAETETCVLPHLDIRYLDSASQSRVMLQLVAELQAWQKKSGLPYGACWISVSDTKHYLAMINDHLISDESSSIAMRSFLRGQLRGDSLPGGRGFSDYVAHIESNLNQDSVAVVEQQLDCQAIQLAREATGEALAKREKMPVQRALFRVPLDYNTTPVDQSFAIFRKLVCTLLSREDFCMILNHYGRQIQGENDFHQVGLFLDKIPFRVDGETCLDELNSKVRIMEDYGVNFVGLSGAGYLGRDNALPDCNSEILFNYQGDQTKDLIVQQWFSKLNIRKLLKQFKGIVFEARQLDRELSIHCIFRGKTAERDALVNSIQGARATQRSLDNQHQQLARVQREKSRARDPLYQQFNQQAKTMESAIKVSQVKKSYGDFEAVKGVNFCVEKGKCFGILGPNGAGKTTLLGMIEGIIKPSEGSIEVLGMDIATQLEKIQPHIGVQLQQNNYFQFLTVEEMLKFYRDFRAAASGRNQGLSIDELLDKLSLSEKRKAKVEELSGGQLQRLTIAIALLEDPDIVFLDEPTSALDPQNRRYTWEFIEQLKAQGDKTIIITTHYMEEAERLCDELLIMNAGQIIAQGTPDELVASLNAHYELSVMLGKGELDDSRVRALTGVTDINWGSNRKDLTISTTQSASTLKELLEYSESEGIELLQFNINRPSLEDVFLSSTGKELRE